MKRNTRCRCKQAVAAAMAMAAVVLAACISEVIAPVPASNVSDALAALQQNGNLTASLSGLMTFKNAAGAPGSQQSPAKPGIGMRR